MFSSFMWFIRHDGKEDCNKPMAKFPLPHSSLEVKITPKAPSKVTRTDVGLNMRLFVPSRYECPFNVIRNTCSFTIIGRFLMPWPYQPNRSFLFITRNRLYWYLFAVARSGGSHKHNIGTFPSWLRDEIICNRNNIVTSHWMDNNYNCQ